MTEFWDKPAEKSGKVLEAFLEGLPLRYTDPVSSLVKICTLWSQVRVYRIQYTFKHMNITFTSFITIMKRLRSGRTMKI
jgi:hypothetical protein